jgi:hypothetical protein
MRIPKIYTASLALAGALALGGTAAANEQMGYAPGYVVSPGFTANAYAPAGSGAFAAAPLPGAIVVAPLPSALCPPGYIYGKSAHASCFDPENGSDPDPRIGGSVKMNSSGDD